MAPDLVLLHGFTQTGASWEPVVRALGESYTAHRPDLRGHGGASDLRPVSFEAVRADLDALVPDGAVLCGYSMGGRIALDWAVRQRAGRISALVLVSASPGLAGAPERAARRRADEQLAARMETLPIEQLAREWAQTPVLAGAPAWLHEDRLRSTPAGLAAALRGLGTGVMEPLWDRLPPAALWVVGERDARFRAIAERTGGRVAVVPGAGHSVHAERPAAIADLLHVALRGDSP
jgi:2-succinyl-6-hydroxy-2,4-cyclohexadiene-1-carboxylate synthase